MRNDPPNVTNKDGHDGSCKCGTKRNLVVCIDGTSNKFGAKNTNIVELYSRLVKDDRQLTFYNSGIGTYAEPSWKSPSYWKQVITNKLDLALALRFEKILLDAYRWLSEMYRPGDRIFLFGFSRGAYQVRALAGMIEKIGLIHKGNGAQIPFAYELYARSTDAQPDTKPKSKDPEYMTWRFKTTFSRKDVKVHFVGAWDTVSSIGFVRPAKDLPLTTSGMKHVCYFRHALALDERRVKFLPEYAYGGASLPSDMEEETIVLDVESSHTATAQTMEVWFPGMHSDIGGGNAVNIDLDSYGPALQWMAQEAILAGVRAKPFHGKPKGPAADNIKRSLTRFWWIFEVLPIRRLSYEDSTETTHRPQMGAPRQVVEGQWIHESAYWDADPAATGLPFKARLPSTWKVTNGRVDDSKIEEDLYNKVRENLRLLLNKPQINPDRFITHLNALVEISSSSEGRISLTEIENSAMHLYSILIDIADTSSDLEDWQLKMADLTVTILLKFPKGRLSKNTPHQMPPVITALLKSTTLDYVERAKRFLQTYGTAEILISPEFPRNLRPSVSSISLDGRCIAVPDSKKLTMWDVITGSALAEPLEGHSSEVHAVAFSQDGTQIVTGSHDRTVRVWDAVTSQALHVLEGHKSLVTCVAFNPNLNTQIVSGSTDGTVRLWNAQTGSNVGEDRRLYNEYAYRQTGREIHVLKGHTSHIRSVAYSPDGKKIASGAMDNTVCLWDAEMGQVQHIAWHMDGVNCVAFSPNGKQIVSGSRDETVRVWDAFTGESVHVLGGHRNWVCSVVYSEDGQKIASSSLDGTVRIWDAEKGQVLDILGENGGPAVFSVRFSPDSKRVISGSVTGIAHVWDMTDEWRDGRFLVGAQHIL
ncbi:WD40 repeat-like protein [Gymnopus androsaceus JB14]|uniref:WD40 repeat-like protein n=1 Tax=Gymnopus androsaceus JB14 TaxID=1447944 RepID=A0A6A4HQU2_9AGAR|nr:WD40 repeat-like protein [Gymnopus androsaceus JB14]